MIGEGDTRYTGSVLDYMSNRESESFFNRELFARLKVEKRFGEANDMKQPRKKRHESN